MTLKPPSIAQYHVFLASPGDVQAERRYVREFFERYNRHTAHTWNARFEVVDWENYGAIGVGRPQQIITRQTLEKYRESLVLVVGIMAQRFGTPSGKAESGTEEEFNWAMESHKVTGHPEIKWFFRKVERLDMPPDLEEARKALEQWGKVQAFRKRMQDLNDPVFFTEYPDAAGFPDVFQHYLQHWLADSARPWATERTARAVAGVSVPAQMPVVFDAERYATAVLRRFEKLDFEMLDTTGAYYSGVRLWKVFVPQSVRECHQYNPRLLEIPKEHQERLLKAGEITTAELEEAERQADRLRQEYFSQPLRPVLEVVDEAFASSARLGQGLVILGDPGAGKSSLIKSLALRWARDEPAVRDVQPIPLLIDLGRYGRWQCDGRKGFVRFLEEAPVWYEWPHGLLDSLLAEPGKAVLLLDGLDEIFDVQKRDEVINDLLRFSIQFLDTPILLTSRVVGYQAQRLRDAEFRHFMLQDLDAGQVAAFVDHWHAETFDSPEQAAPKRDRLLKAIHDSKSIEMLAGNPLLLTMMAILNRNQELPRDRAELYTQASRVLLHQWDTERALADYPGLSAHIGLREKTDILRRVAWRMQAGPGGLKGNMIDGGTLTGVIEDYLREELHIDQARAVARTVVEHLRLRNFILCFVGADSFAFVHRTFLEHFCAAEVVHRFNVTKSLDLDGLYALFGEHCGQDEWHEVLRLICGQIDEAFVGAIVERLATRTDLEDWDCETPLPELPLAIECLAEVRNPAKLMPAGDAVLESIIRCFMAGDHLDIDTYVRQKIIPASQGLGGKWPRSKSLSGRALEIADSIAGSGSQSWPEFVAAVDPHRPTIEPFLSHSRWEFRAGACRALAERWPDDVSRALLAQHAVRDDNYAPRSVALRTLAEKWPDDEIRALLAERAVQDYSFDTRGVALGSLGEKWPDDLTRTLLAQRAVQDDHPYVRSVALRSLAEKWPDDVTRTLLADRVVRDDDHAPRGIALHSLAEKWPDDLTRTLLAQHAVQDDHPYVRSVALRSLAERWPDDATRTLLAERSVRDDNYGPRSIALQSLAKKWPDDVTRTLLAQRAVQDNNFDTRSVALRSLAETWPDDVTRALLAQRSVQDVSYVPRTTALQSLAEKWPSVVTRTLLVGRVIQDPDVQVRGAAFSALGAIHSRFGRILPTRDLDGRAPYLDPREPVSREHVENAAKRANIRREDIDTRLASLSAHVGWDISRGAAPLGQTTIEKPRNKRGR